MARGKYIVIDGLETSGKAEQLDLLSEALKKLNLPVKIFTQQDLINFAETGGSNQRSKILASAAQFSEESETIENLTSRGYYCLADHNYLSFVVSFQNNDKISSRQDIGSIADFVYGGAKPDLTILLDVDTAKLESGDSAQAELERATFLLAANQKNIPIVYSAGSTKDTFGEIWQLVRKTIKPRKRRISATLESVANILANSPLSFLTTTDSLKSKKPSAQPTSPPQPVNPANEQGKYHVPPNLDHPTKELYQQKLDEILKLHHELVSRLSGHLASTKSDSSESDESFETANVIAGAVLPLATIGGIKQIINSSNADHDKVLSQYIKDGYDDPSRETATLLSYTPKNELDILPDIFYESTNLNFKNLSAELSSLPYAEKAKILTAYTNNNSQLQALNQIRYSWEFMTDFWTYKYFAELGLGRLHHQPPTPRFGYDVPEAVEQAGLTDLYEQCFETSLELYSALQPKYPREAGLATLAGHKLRWLLLTNAPRLSKLHEAPGTQYNELIGEVVEKVSEVHPLIAELMRFSNQAAKNKIHATERSKQFKLQEINN